MMRLMRITGMTTCAIIASMALIQCTGCRSIKYGCWWVADGIVECRQDIRNSSQRSKHINAFGKKMRAEQPMVSVYDVSMFPVGKTTSIHYRRWISLFADGSFIALESRETRKFLSAGRKSLAYVSGQWERGEGAKIVLKCREGTSFGDSFGKDISIDLSSIARFPPANALPPWRLPQPYETLPTLPDGTGQAGTGD